MEVGFDRFGESASARVEVGGTSFALHYESIRTPAGSQQPSLQFPISGDSVPDSLKRIDVEVEVAGQIHTKEHPPEPNQTHEFTWDGTDAYGRPVGGSQPVDIRIGYVYDGVYQEPNSPGSGGGGGSGGASFSQTGADAITGNRSRQEITLWEEINGVEQDVYITSPNARLRGMGGWSLDVRHEFNGGTNVVEYGDGRHRKLVQDQSSGFPIRTVAGIDPDAQLREPRGCDLGPEGNLYVADRGLSSIKRVTPEGRVETYAGTGGIVHGASEIEDGGQATEGGLIYPTDVAVDDAGQVYYAESFYGRIRTILPDGTVETVAGNRESNAEFVADPASPSDLALGTTGALTAAPDGALYVTDPRYGVVWRVDHEAGEVDRVAGTGAEDANPSYIDPGTTRQATETPLKNPTGVAVDGDGRVYVSGGHRSVLRVDPDGTVRTVAGDSSLKYDEDGVPATEAGLAPVDVALDGDGGYYVTDGYLNAIRHVDGSGTISTVGASPGKEAPIEGPVDEVRFDRPLSIVVDGEELYVADQYLETVRHVSAGGTVSRVIGNTERTVDVGLHQHSEDGQPAAPGRVGWPDDVLAAPDGTVYIADRTAALVRAVRPDGTLETVAGTGDHGYSGDGGPATEAQLSGPTALELAADGSLYVAEENNHVVRKVRPDGTITTAVGTGDYGSDGDGGPATEARLNQPRDLALDADDNLYVATSNRIRRVGRDGTIATVAGAGDSRLPSDGSDVSSLGRMRFLSIVTDGNDGLYFSIGGSDYGVWYAQPDGTLYHVENTETSAGQTDVDADDLLRVWDMARGPDGALYLSDHLHTVHRVVPGEERRVVLGRADNPPKNQAMIGELRGLDVDGEGRLYMCDQYHGAVRRIGQEAASLGWARAVPSADGSEIYEFGLGGRHERTADGFTGETLLSFEYDETGRFIGVTDADGDTTTIERDDDGALAAIVSPDGHRTEVSIDGDGYIAELTDPAGESVTCEYDGGILTSITDPAGRTTGLGYDGGRLRTLTDPAGNETTLEVGGSSTVQASTVETAAGRSETLELSSAGAGIHVTNRENDVTIGGDHTEIGLDYPGAGSATVTLDRDQRFERNAPVPAETVTETPGGRSQTMRTSRTVSLSEAEDPTAVESVTETVTVEGRTMRDRYDAATGEVTTTYPAGRTVTKTLGTAGRVESVTASGLGTTTYGYDDRGRVESIATESGGERRAYSFAYGDDGYLASFEGPRGTTQSYDRDPLGRVTSVTTPAGDTTSFEYDASGNLTAVTPPDGPAHEFGYDDLARLASYSPPGTDDGWSYEYDADGYPTRIDPPSGDTYAATWNDRGRKTAETLPRGTIQYTYDETTKNLTRVEGPDGAAIEMDYDGPLPTGQTLSGDVGGSVSWTYDDRFLLSEETVDGTTIAVGYDDDNLVTSAGALSITRNDAGIVTGATLDSVEQTWQVDGFGDVGLHEATASGSSLLALDYTRDERGAVSEVEETVDGTTTTVGHDYDDAGRLVAVREGGQVVDDLEYDARGNVVSRERDGSTVQPTYDDRDRLQSWGNREYEWDADGRLASVTGSGGTTEYEFDALGSLRSVSLADGTEVEYVVDPLGRRVGKKVDGSLQRGWLYRDGTRPAAELDGDGNVVARFVYGTHDRVPDYVIKGGTTYAVLSDHLGSPRLVVDAATGDVTQRMEYDAFGRVTTDTNPGFQPFGFAGGLYDPDTGLVQFGMREYDARVGRWTAPDPIGFGGGQTNLYVYASNDPVNNVDASGLDPTALVRAGVGAAVGGGFEAGMQLYQHGEIRSWGKVGVSAVVGGATAAVGPAAAGLAKGTKLGKAGAAAASAGVEAAGGAGEQMAKNAIERADGDPCDDDPNLTDGVLQSAVGSAVGSGVGSKASNPISRKVDARDALSKGNPVADKVSNKAAKQGNAEFAESVPTKATPNKTTTKAIEAGGEVVGGTAGKATGAGVSAAASSGGGGGGGGG